ncbi:DUF4097 family beta strand repeat-containing protein [Arthrobacter cupressi]|uniref:Putative adhesin n=1 Tax=Arthrobacter cupressi TaxID=1045773 RepID=A0A1G8U088_9MICC|nr:DUF4097 family beta strand repeat-containing protein [Arthrobacter cupressi]NYD76640.1 hypothetical protein [Arthrobacter cupressi]SDJ46420.1 Putative adhesin [Arthrobacter cupressi]
MSEQNWTVTGPQTIDVDGVRSLRLGIVKGRFDIVTHDEATARIEVSEIAGDPLSITIVDGRLEIRHQLHGAQGWFRNLMDTVSNTSNNTAVIGIAVPAGITVEAGTVSGDGMVSGTSATTRLNTVSGSVLSDGTSGELHVNTVSGEVIARDHHGVMTAKSVSGEVTASGDFSNVRASTVSGDLSFDLHGHTRDLAAHSVSGDVTVRLPRDIGADVAAKSASGAVVIDGQLHNHPGNNVQTTVGPTERITLVRCNSVSGKTYVIHGSAAATGSPAAGGQVPGGGGL